MHHTDLPHPTPAPRRHAATLLHAAGLSLALLLGLATSAPAQAGLIIQSGTSVISAATSSSALETDTMSATLGFNQHSVVSTSSNGLAVARAVSSIIFTDTDVAAGGIGAVTGETAEASALNVLLFTLSGSHAVTGQMQFEIAGPAKMAASMDLSLEGGASLLSATLDTLTAPLDFALTLGPGTYRFVGQAGLQQNGLLPDDARVGFFVAMSFTELGDPDNEVPGNAVPEPASLALALSGLLACGVVRRQRVTWESEGQAEPLGW